MIPEARILFGRLWEALPPLQGGICRLCYSKKNDLFRPLEPMHEDDEDRVCVRCMRKKGMIPAEYKVQQEHLRQCNPDADFDGWGGGTHGGYRADLPTPALYRWPCPKGTKRPVRASIMSFEGTVGGAIHHIPRLEEYPNSIWCSNRHSWVYPWDGEKDPQLQGRRFEGPVYITNREGSGDQKARLWIRETFYAQFDPWTHELMIGMSDEKPTDDWFYGREGD